jgi:hypothetical protein
MSATVMISILVGMLAAFAGALVYWRIRGRRQNRLVSLVAMVREPVTFEPAVLARVGGRVWKADLADGSSHGANGFVVGIGVMNTITYDG